MLTAIIVSGFAFIVAQIIMSFGKNKNEDKTKIKSDNYNLRRKEENYQLNVDEKYDLNKIEEEEEEVDKDKKTKKIIDVTKVYTTESLISDEIKGSEIISMKAIKVDDILMLNPKITFQDAEEENQNKLKFIGYEPSTKFEQKVPLNYPMVFMPKSGSVIKYPRKGKQGLKGFTENLFKKSILENFNNLFQIYDDRFVLYKSNQNPFEPDFTLIDETNDINLFIDIEIDEPYDGISRQPIHFMGFDKQRNSFFKNRGWIVIRFAEYQVFKETMSCCKFIAEVINSVNPNFTISEKLSKIKDIGTIKQWTKGQSIKWAIEKYREKYLGINEFEKHFNNVILLKLNETEIGSEIENYVIEDQTNSIKNKKTLIDFAINHNGFISLKTSGKYSIIKPNKIENSILFGFCYLKNLEVKYDINKLNDIVFREKPFLIKINGVTERKDIKSFIIKYIGSKNPIRIKYAKSTYRLNISYGETGEIILSEDERDSLRTITNFDFVSRVYSFDKIKQYKLNDEDYISGFCNSKQELRTFKFDRIKDLEILNI
ncbi:MAG: WYL domain-containing protein [Flavobacteriales bacterium]|nr:WYL domain-containing protein [Flavobacteriales bacterium]